MAASYPRQNSLDNISYTPNFIFPLGDSSTELGSTNFRVLATSIRTIPLVYISSSQSA